MNTAYQSMRTLETLPATVDVLIAGAGPAGLSAAIALVRAERSVVIVDSRAKIGHPLRCGEVTSNRIFRVLAVKPNPAWIRCTMGRNANLIALDREIMEFDLANLLAEHGAFVAAGVSVTGVGPFDSTGRQVSLSSGRTTKQIYASCVLAADGVSSSVARFAGIDTHLPINKIASGFAYRLMDVTLRNHRNYHLEMLPQPYPTYPHYFWVIPNGESQANVGLYLPGKDGNKAKKLLKTMMKTSSAISGGRIVQTIAGAISDVMPPQAPFADGLMILGSAARMVDPRTGGGIWYAAISGRAAARTLVGLKGAPATAERLWNYRWLLENKVYKKLQRQWLQRRITTRRLNNGLPAREARFENKV